MTPFDDVDNVTVPAVAADATFIQNTSYLFHASPITFRILIFEKVKSDFVALIVHGFVVELVDNINEPFSLSIYVLLDILFKKKNSKKSKKKVL